jgi:hypothetical protein
LQKTPAAYTLTGQVSPIATPIGEQKGGFVRNGHQEARRGNPSHWDLAALELCGNNERGAGFSWTWPVRCSSIVEIGAEGSAGESIVAFRFNNAACVVLGTFNMYIVQPAWLAGMKIIPKEIVVTIGSKFDEPGFRFSSPKLASRWFVSPNRVVVETENPNEDCGKHLAKVLKRLPWTPLAAIGNNASYKAPLSDLPLLTKNMRNAPDLPEGFALAQRSFHFALSQGNRVFNVQLSVTPEEIQLATNVHTELANVKKETSGTAQTAAKRFLQDRTEAEALIEHFFKVRIDHANSNGKPA